MLIDIRKDILNLEKELVAITEKFIRKHHIARFRIAIFNSSFNSSYSHNEKEKENLRCNIESEFKI